EGGQSGRRGGCATDRRRRTAAPGGGSISEPPCDLFARQPPAVSVSPRAVTYRGRPSTTASPFRWQRSSAARAETNRGCQRGTKLYLGLRVARQENRVFTIQSSSPAHATSWMPICPVTMACRGR